MQFSERIKALAIWQFISILLTALVTGVFGGRGWASVARWLPSRLKPF